LSDPDPATVGRRALVTGISGQDGSFLAELLLEKGYDVTGLVRAGRSLGLSEPLRDRLAVLTADLLEPATLRAAVEHAAPQELYHLGAPSFVPASWQRPAETLVAIAGGTGALLEAVRDVDPRIRVYSAASGAMFGDAPESPQREETPCRPNTPYAVAKLAAHQLVGAVRVHDDLHASSGITFNHESERRPERFVTRKVTRAAAAVKLGLESEVVLGDLDAVRDWSFAGDVVCGAWLMLQQDRPDDYILASGVPRTVADLARTAFACVGLDADRYVRVDDSLVRRPEATPNVGSPAKARAKLGWEPQLSFEALVERMVRADLRTLQATR
jgi:GDPmannose 4,6-dehydratase